MIKNIQKSDMNVTLWKGIIAYIFLFLFAYIFIPKTNTYFETFLLGFLLYGVYDTTNFAVFDNWDPSVAIADMLWGGTLFCLIRYFSQ